MVHDNRMFTADDLRPVEPAIDRIRHNPTRYLGVRLPTAPFMASALVQDALLCGAEDVRVRHYGDKWTLVSANEDWIIPNIKWERPPTYEHVFRSLIPFPQAGVNSFRSEVLVAAFSTDLSVVQGTSVSICMGSSPPEGVITCLKSEPFAVVFRLRDLA
jgi:hypothetical protein